MHTGLPPPNFGTRAKAKRDARGSDRVENRCVIVLGIEHAARDKRTLKRATLTRIRTDDLSLAMSR